MASGQNNSYNDELLSSGQPQMAKDGLMNPNYGQSNDYHQQMNQLSNTQNPGQQDNNFLHQTGEQVKTMAHGAADIASGAARGAVNITQGAAAGAANMAQGAADAVKKTFGINPTNTNSNSNSDLPVHANQPTNPNTRI